MGRPRAGGLARDKPIGCLPIPWLRPYEGVADGEIPICPVRASGTAAAMVPNRRWNRRRARVLSPAFDLFGATGADMDTKEQPAMPLKEQGNRNSMCGARIGGNGCSRSGVAKCRRHERLIAAAPASPFTTV